MESLEPRLHAASVIYAAGIGTSAIWVGDHVEVTLWARAVDAPGLAAAYADVSVDPAVLHFLHATPLPGWSACHVSPLGGLLDDFGCQRDPLADLTAEEWTSVAVAHYRAHAGFAGVTASVAQIDAAFASRVIGSDVAVPGAAYLQDLHPSGAATVWGPVHVQPAADVNRDGHVQPLDALIVINAHNACGPWPAAAGDRLDVNGNGTAAEPADVLAVINALRPA